MDNNLVEGIVAGTQSLIKGMKWNVSVDLMRDCLKLSGKRTKNSSDCGESKYQEKIFTLNPKGLTWSLDRFKI